MRQCRNDPSGGSFRRLSAQDGRRHRERSFRQTVPNDHHHDHDHHVHRPFRNELSAYHDDFSRPDVCAHSAAGYTNSCYFDDTNDRLHHQGERIFRSHQQLERRDRSPSPESRSTKLSLKFLRSSTVSIDLLRSLKSPSIT